MIKPYPDYNIEKIKTFFDFYQRMQGFGDRLAFVNNEKEITYAEFVTDIARVASCFTEKGKFILVRCPDKYNYVVALFAAVLSDNIACLQPSNLPTLPCYTTLQFFADVDDAYMADALTKEPCTLAPRADTDAVCMVLCSSGTTAVPKAIAISEWNVISDFLAGMEKYEFATYGKFVNILPYSHAFGVVCDLMGPLYACSTIYFAYTPVDFLMKLPKYNPTALNIIPALVGVLAKQIAACGDKTKIVGNALTKILSGGAGTPKRLCEAMEKFGIGVYGCYGLTECSPCVCVNRDFANKFGSAGVPLNCNQVTIDENGEILVSGTNIMKGYLDKDGNCIPVENGVYRSKDVGYFDEDGYLYIIGRCDDLIVFMDGNKLYPTIVEEKICEVPGVVECVVYKKDERLCCQATVADEAMSASIREAILSRDFDGVRVYEVVCSIDPLVKNAMGKLNRKVYNS